MALINRVEGDGLDMLWYQLLQDLTCGLEVSYNYPNIYKRFTLGSSTELKFTSPENQMLKDFFKFSHYSYKTKMNQLYHEYLDDRVKAQIKLIKENLRHFHPRQARAVVYFSRDAYDMSSKLKCLETLSLQKSDMTHFSAYLTFRNTEVFPKSLMDFILVKQIVREIENASKCVCDEFNCVIMNSFISIHHAGMVAMFLQRWGLSNWNPSFKRMLEVFYNKFSDMEKIEKLKFISIKRTLQRFHRLRNELGFSMEDICL